MRKNIIRVAIGRGLLLLLPLILMLLAPIGLASLTEEDDDGYAILHPLQEF